MCNTAAMYQGVEAGTNAEVLNDERLLSRTAPYKIIAVGPCSSGGTPDDSSVLRSYILIFPRTCPARMRTAEYPWRAVSPVPTPNDSEDMSNYVPALLTQYVPNELRNESSPYHVTQDEVLALLQRLELKKITGHRSVRGRSGVIALMCGTH